MTRLGIIARADNGGLGAQTWELWRHLRPARTLIVMAGATERGGADLARYGAPGYGARWATPGGWARAVFDRPDLSDARWLCKDVDVLWTAETWYGHDVIPEVARAAGVRTVIHANPELWTGDEHADRVLVATPWLLERMPPRTDVLPFPVARDRLPARHVDEVTTLYHPASPAMLDRNGTEILLRALPYVRAECRVVIRGADPRLRPLARTGGRVEVVWLDPHPGPYHEAWLDAVDALVLPRRYGGLSLPMQEAASLGLPVVALDVSPQNGWLHPELRVPASSRRQARMRGGKVTVHDGDPRALARVIDRLVTDRRLAAAGAEVSLTHADAISWDALRPVYLDVLASRPPG